MKKLNNKGVGGIEFCVLVFALSSAGITGMALTKNNPEAFASFRAKKAISYCQSEGGSADSCKTTVAGMSKPEVLAYIKDTAERPRP